MPNIIDSKTPSTYDAFRNPESEFHFEKYLRMKKFVNLGKKSAVLEIGAGTGVYTAFLVKDFEKVTATDIDEEMLLLLKKKFPKIKTRAADCSILPFEENSFDLVFGVSILHHVPGAERKRVFNEAKRVLKKNGFFVLFEPNKLNPMTSLFQLMQGEDAISRFELKKFFKASGFSEIAVKEVLLSVPFAKKSFSKKPFLANLEKLVEGLGLGVTVMAIAGKR